MQKRSRKIGQNIGAWGGPSSMGSILGIRVVILSNFIKVLLPPLFFSALPKRAIGFSFPSGREGKLVGAGMVGATAVVSILLAKMIGVPGIALAAWLTGGTATVMLYNSTREKVAFVKQHCQSCRLRPLIEEHEAMHLDGEASEEVVWMEARRKHSYHSLGLASDPRICSFCPIPKKLRDR